MDRSGSWIIYWKSRHRCQHITNMYDVCCRVMQSKINSKCYSRRQAIDYFSIGNIQFAWIVGTWHSIIPKKRESRRCNILLVKVGFFTFWKVRRQYFHFYIFVGAKEWKRNLKKFQFDLWMYGIWIHFNQTIHWIRWKLLGNQLISQQPKSVNR